MGDMVWGKVKSHPWWPGHIYNESLASSSVRRTKRDGHILVAFFGDSSYGWFDVTQLIPYEPHYIEKSNQLNSRNFVRAVRESIDEASRRSALGLSCCCRNVYNFRPASVPGYVVVDVVGYDPGAVYSVSQVRKAREGFSPLEALSFVRELAVAPKTGESKSLDFVKQRAVALAYRRAVFEEFDETYAQAFGEQPVRPSQMPPSLLTSKERSQAPLSGTLVMAETLRRPKRSTKARKSKESSKKDRDRYLFKRRDEAGKKELTSVSQVNASSSSSSACEEGTSYSIVASYVFQKRDQALLDSVNDNTINTSAKDEISTSALAHTVKDVSIAGLNVPITMDATADSLQSRTSAMAVAIPTPSEVGSAPPDPVGTINDPVKKNNNKKKNDVKSLAVEQNVEEFDLQENKKKKKRRKIVSEHPDRIASETVLSCSKKDIEMGSLVVLMDKAELPQMLVDLHGLGVDPFHGVERTRLAILLQFFLKYRFLVFLKSSTGLSTSETDPSENQVVRPVIASTEDNSKVVVPPVKPPSKLSPRHKDPTKGGSRKRTPSENQEENDVTKRAKKTTAEKDLKKKPEIKSNGTKKPPLKPVKPTEQQEKKRVDRQARNEEPTYLVMKFESGSSLPSLVELKARFARFGPLDTSLSRVFYKTNTCRVAFLYKQDAHVAFRYAVANKPVFSNVKFMLRPVAEPAPPPPSSTRAPTNNTMHQQHLESCLKKPEDAGPPTKATRVKFHVPRVSEKGCPSSLSSSNSIAVNVVNNNQRLISSSHDPLHTSPLKHLHVNVASRNDNFNHHNNLVANIRPPPGPPPQPCVSRDISQQMMKLLTRCHDVVTNIKSVFGYVPYHPL